MSLVLLNQVGVDCRCAIHAYTFQVVNCKLQREKNHTLEESARQNRTKVHHDIAAARRGEVAQASVQQVFSVPTESCAQAILGPVQVELQGHHELMLPECDSRG